MQNKSFTEFYTEAMDLPPPQPIPIVRQAKPKAVTPAPATWLTADFVKYIADAENGVKRGFNSKTKLWKPHDSPEGGAKTIAFGHKLMPGESFNKGITTTQAHQLLITDLQKAAKEAAKVVNARKSGAWDKLTPEKKQMSIDLTFNLGGGGFAEYKNFINALIANDIETMKREYKRTAVINGERVPISDRNSRFAARFFK